MKWLFDLLLGYLLLSRLEHTRKEEGVFLSIPGGAKESRLITTARP